MAIGSRNAHRGHLLFVSSLSLRFVCCDLLIRIGLGLLQPISLCCVHRQRRVVRRCRLTKTAGGDSRAPALSMLDQSSRGDAAD